MIPLKEVRFSNQSISQYTVNDARKSLVESSSLTTFVINGKINGIDCIVHCQFYLYTRLALFSVRIEVLMSVKPAATQLAVVAQTGAMQRHVHLRRGNSNDFHARLFNTLKPCCRAKVFEQMSQRCRPTPAQVCQWETLLIAFHLYACACAHSTTVDR